MSVSNLKNICLELREDEPSIDKNFFAVNMHGDELKEDFIIPEGVRIVMFCYPGKKLDICQRFDEFNWREIFLNEDASYNYCTFLGNLSQYSSLRDHFCVYKAGNRIRDLRLSSDQDFRHGVYKLPVYAGSYDYDNEQAYVSSPEIFDKFIGQTKNIKRVSVNKKIIAKIAKDNKKQLIILSKHILIQKINLSSLVKKLLFEMNSGFTLLLLTCRTGEIRDELFSAPLVREELGKMFENYSKEMEK